MMRMTEDAAKPKITARKYQELSGRERLDAFHADLLAWKGQTEEDWEREDRKFQSRIYTDFYGRTRFRRSN